jgi:hypothetical protein
MMISMLKENELTIELRVNKAGVDPKMKNPTARKPASNSTVSEATIYREARKIKGVPAK